jgi:hypothetical protein
MVNQRWKWAGCSGRFVQRDVRGDGLAHVQRALEEEAVQQRVDVGACLDVRHAHRLTGHG